MRCPTVVCNSWPSVFLAVSRPASPACVLQTHTTGVSIHLYDHSPPPESVITQDVPHDTRSIVFCIECDIYLPYFWTIIIGSIQLQPSICSFSLSPGEKFTNRVNRANSLTPFFSLTLTIVPFHFLHCFYCIVFIVLFLLFHWSKRWDETESIVGKSWL